MKIYVFLPFFTFVSSFSGTSRRGLFEKHMNGKINQREIKEENGSKIELIDLMLARALLMREEMSKYSIIKQQVFEKINPRLKIANLNFQFEKLFDEFYMKYFLKK
jgi:hypothetical protein